jgi:hypothetical protein
MSLGISPNWVSFNETGYQFTKICKILFVGIGYSFRRRGIKSQDLQRFYCEELDLMKNINSSEGASKVDAKTRVETPVTGPM